MPPRLLQLLAGALLATCALAACRKEVPTPPVPDEIPRPKVEGVSYLAHVALPATPLRRVA